MKHKLTRRFSVLAAVVAASLVVSGSALGDTFTVTNDNDAGRGSLRQAIIDANARSGRDTITFAPKVSGTIDLESTLPALQGAVELRGPGAEKLTVRRNPAPDTPRFGIFVTLQRSIVTISDLRISGGRAPYGGGIYGGSDGELTIQNVVFATNAANWWGGAIKSWGGLTVRDSTFSANTAANGGAIESNGRVSVEGSTFSRNEANYGGGINHFSYGNVSTIRNSTFSANTANYDGGGIRNFDTLDIEGSTLSGNTAGRDGGGVVYSSSAGEVTFRATIVAGNEAPEGPDVSGDISTPISSGGYNLIGDTRGSRGFGATDLRNVEPGLDPEGLKNNGGPTQTIALPQSSSAVDAVREGCPPPATDQRGVTRPQDGDGDGTALCDIGAYERRTSP